MDNMCEKINDYVFHYSPYTKMWSAIHRDHYREFWNDYDNDNIIRSSELESLMADLNMDLQQE